MLKQAPFQFQRQHPLHGPIQNFFVDQATFQCFLQPGKALVPQADVDPGVQGQRPGSHCTAGLVVQPVNGAAVGHNDPIEAELPAEDFLQQIFVGVAWHAVDLIIGGHYARYARPAGCSGGGQVNFPQFPRTDTGRAGVQSAGGLPLRAEMLGHYRHALTLNAPDDGTGKLRCMERILTVAFLTAAPAGIPQDIQHGHQRQVHAQFPKLPPADLSCLIKKLRLKGSPCRQIHRQQIAVQRLMAVGTFAADQHGNAEPGMLHHEPLGQIVGADGVFPIQAVFPGAARPWVGPVQAVKRAQAAEMQHFFLKGFVQCQLLSLPADAPKAV